MPRHDRDRELEALGGVDGHDPHGVVVGLRQHGLGDPGALRRLLVDPLEVGPQAPAGGLAPRPRLVDHEPQPPPHVAGTAFGEAELEGAALAGDVVEELGGGLPVAALVDARAGTPGPPTRCRRAGSGGVGVLYDQVRPCATLWRNRSSSPQPSSGVRSAVTMRRWSVGSSAAREDHEEVADGPAGVDERAGLGPEGDAGGLERVLEERQRGARRDEDRDVAEAARPPRVRGRGRGPPSPRRARW